MSNFLYCQSVLITTGRININSNGNEVPHKKPETHTRADDPIDFGPIRSKVDILKDSDKNFLKNLIADAISERLSIADSRGSDKIKMASTIYQLFFILKK